VIWPALGFVLVMKSEIILTLYGSVWLESVPAITWLCLAVAIQTAFSLVTTALTGMGKPYVTAMPIATTLVIKAVAAWWLFDGSLHSFAIAILLGDVASIPIYLVVLKAQLGIDLRKWLDVQARPAAVTLAVCLLAWGWRTALAPTLPAWALLGTACVATMAGWLLAAMLLRLPIWNETKPIFLRWQRR
jgi:O-antigen/teichoic acid export membrane protein